MKNKILFIVFVILSILFGIISIGCITEIVFPLIPMIFSITSGPIITGFLEIFVVAVEIIICVLAFFIPLTLTTSCIALSFLLFKKIKSKDDIKKNIDDIKEDIEKQ